jgi:hypothetical protein
MPMSYFLTSSYQATGGFATLRLYIQRFDSESTRFRNRFHPNNHSNLFSPAITHDRRTSNKRIVKFLQSRHRSSLRRLNHERWPQTPPERYVHGFPEIMDAMRRKRGHFVRCRFSSSHFCGENAYGVGRRSLELECVVGSSGSSESKAGKSNLHDLTTFQRSRNYMTTHLLHRLHA